MIKLKRRKSLNFFSLSIFISIFFISAHSVSGESDLEYYLIVE
jgi:hypothetical protein